MVTRLPAAVANVRRVALERMLGSKPNTLRTVVNMVGCGGKASANMRVKHDLTSVNRLVKVLSERAPVLRELSRSLSSRRDILCSKRLIFMVLDLLVLIASGRRVNA